jgi:RNA polymerase-binding transcription factor DksA
VPLTDDQRRHLEARLLEERERARRTVEQYDRRLRVNPRDESGDLSSVPFHLADEGSDAMQRELNATVVTQASRELQAIEAALDRLYRRPHAFGISEDTGEEIPFERLDAIPWATTGTTRG